MSQIKKIILISIDALRQDSLGCYGYEKKVTPFLDELARRGTKFVNAFATGPYSAASFPSILASAYPMQYGEYLPLPKQTTMISEVLGRKGWKCGAFHSSVYMSRYYGYDKGFDLFEDYATYKKVNSIKSSSKEKIVQILQKSEWIYGLVEKSYGYFKWLFKSDKSVKPNETAERITDDVIKWLGAGYGEKVFIWAHYMDVHTPYIPPDKYRLKVCPEISKKEMYALDLKIQRARKNLIELSSLEITKLKSLYDAVICYVDDEIKRLMGFLEEEGLSEETLVVVISDHGEEFNEHGDFYHKAKAFDVNLHVPLILSQKFNVNSNKIVSLIDLPRTLVDLVGVGAPVNWKGVNILSENRNFVYFENYHTKQRRVLDEFAKDRSKFFFRGIRTKDFKLIVDDIDGEMLFDLRTDAGEKINLVGAGEYSGVLEKLKGQLNKMIQDNLPKEREKVILEGPEMKEDEAARSARISRLESLGYLD